MSVASLALSPCTFAEPEPPAGRRLPRPLQFALVLSALLHAMALGWLPGFERLAADASLPLRIVLPPPAETEAPPPVAVAPAPMPAPAAVARRVLAAPPQATTPAPAIVPEIAHVPPQQREDLPPVAVSRPTIVAPVAEPATQATESASLDPHALAGYGRSVAGALAVHQRYPRIAQLRQWQGTAMLRLEFAADGRMLDSRVLSSSGHEVLDRQALDMLRAALPLPPLPAALAGRSLVVNVPVVFRLGG